MRISDWSSDVCSSDLADVTWNDGLEHHLAEHGADIVGDLPGKVVAPVVHGKRHAEDGEAAIEAGADALDRLQELTEPLEREEFGLERAKDRLGGDQRRSEEHKSELQPIMRISHAISC